MGSSTSLQKLAGILAAATITTAAVTPPLTSSLHLKSTDSDVVAAAAAITWAACPTDINPFKGNNATEKVQCTNFSVPLNYNDAAGASINLGIVKLPAMGKRIGNLFVNPGGPGGLVSSFVLRIATNKIQFGEAVRQNFDIIGMDPRGMGLSTPMKSDVNLFNQPNDFDSTTPEGFQKLFEYNKAIGESTRAMSGPLFDNVDTTTVARDMEAVRVAAGNEPMNYIGFSYGTLLGAKYAALFPDTIRAMVLDSILSHSGTHPSRTVLQTSTLDLAIQDFFGFCEASAGNCGEGGQEIRQTWNKVVESAKTGQLKAAQCDGTIKTQCRPDVTLSDVISSVRTVLKSPGRRKELADQLRLAVAGNGSFLTAEILTGDAYLDSGTFAAPAVLCQDGIAIAAKDHIEVQRTAELARSFTVTPGVLEYWKQRVDCTGYPVNVSNPPKTLSIKGLQNPALLVHIHHDPATNLVDANELNDQFEKSVLVLVEGSGHVSYRNRGEAAKLMDDYLVDLKMPPAGTIVQS